MFDTFNQRLIALVIPITLLVACSIAFIKLAIIPKEWQSLLTEALPILTLAIGLIVSIQFNRSRYTFLLAMLTSAAMLMLYYQKVLATNTLHLLFTALFINIFLFSFVKDRSLFSSHGIIRLIFLIIQIPLIWICLNQFPDPINKIITLDLFTAPTWLEHYLNIPDLLLIIAASVIVLHFLLVFILHNSTIQATFFGCQLGLLGIISGYHSDLLIPLVGATCCLMICISILLSSYDMAYRDELTSLPSRRALNQMLLSLGRRYTIAMLDIDHFKKFNDTHGHDIGDEVLRMVASKIARITGGGKPFRYGGEEFTIVFPRKSAAQVESHLDDLRQTITNYQMAIRSKKRLPDKAQKKSVYKREHGKNSQKTLSVTISIGIAERSNNHKKPDDVIKSADEALYRAKKKGRNCLSL